MIYDISEFIVKNDKFLIMIWAGIMFFYLGLEKYVKGARGGCGTGGPVYEDKESCSFWWFVSLRFVFSLLCFYWALKGNSP